MQERENADQRLQQLEQVITGRMEHIESGNELFKDQLFHAMQAQQQPAHTELGARDALARHLQQLEEAESRRENRDRERGQKYQFWERKLELLEHDRVVREKEAERRRVKDPAHLLSSFMAQVDHLAVDDYDQVYSWLYSRRAASRQRLDRDLDIPATTTTLATSPFSHAPKLAWTAGPSDCSDSDPAYSNYLDQIQKLMRLHSTPKS